VRGTVQCAKMRSRSALPPINPQGPLGCTQPLRLVANLAQQVFPPRKVGVGFDIQRRGASTTPRTPRPSAVCATITCVGLAVAQEMRRTSGAAALQPAR
jgi:hypothetical protein